MRNDDYYMQYVVALAQANQEPFASIIVNEQSGAILAEGVNSGQADITAHSEIIAIRKVQTQYQPSRENKLLLFSTGEPCPMCAGAIVYFSLNYIPITRIIFGTNRPTLITLGWDEFNKQATFQSVISLAKCQIKYTSGIQQTATNELFQKFKTKIKREIRTPTLIVGKTFL